MKRSSLALLCVALVVAASLLAVTPAAGATNPVCVASPSSGPDGTTFHLTASGFSPQAQLWTYAVDPTGVAFADPVNQGVGGGVKADNHGTVSFAFASRYVEQDTDTEFSRALGNWTLVVEERDEYNRLVHQAECGLTITAVPAPLTGAQVVVTPSTGFQDQVLLVSGSGFQSGEMVNLWLTPPVDCGAFAFEFDNQLAFHSAASAFGLDGVRADSAGHFVDFILPNTFTYCAGEWAVSARGAVSRLGGIGRFVLAPHQVNPHGATLTVQPSAALVQGGTLVFSGSGFTPGENVACWSTRPEGNVREFHGIPANGAGNMQLVYTTGLAGFSVMGMSDTPDMHYSEGSPGVYSMSCVGQTSQHLAITQYMLVSPAVDP